MAREIYGALLIGIFDCHYASNNRNRIRGGMHFIFKKGLHLKLFHWIFSEFSLVPKRKEMY